MSIYDDLPGHGKLDGIFKAKFASPVPSDQTDPAFVIMPFLSDQHKVGPMPWSPAEQAGNTPSLGDKCLVAYDERENPYIIAWWHSGSFSL